MQSTLIRTTTVAVMVTAALSWGGTSRAADAAPASASISAVTCVDGDGTVDVILTAGDSPTAFAVYLDGLAHGDGNPVPVAAGETGAVHLTGLTDEDHLIAVDLAGEPDSEGDPQTLTTETRTPECDRAPEGAYTNAKGSVSDFCTSDVEVTASNRPIGGNTTDLQPAVFTVTIEPFAEQPSDGDGGDGEVPAEERATEEPLPELLAPVVLDTFTLDADTPTYQRAFGYDEVGYAGLVTLRVGETVIASGYFYGPCVVLATAGGAAVPNTGA